MAGLLCAYLLYFKLWWKPGIFHLFSILIYTALKKFITRIGIFGLLFVLNAIFIIIIDPYNIFFDSNFIDNEIKLLNLNRSDKVMPRGNALWKLTEYSRSPCNNIIIGDSRSRHINVELVKQLSGEDYYNFGIPGGNVNLIRDAFWMADSLANLKNVYIQVGFHNYNKNRDFDICKLVKTYAKNPFKMFFKSWFTIDSYYALLLEVAPKYRDILHKTQENVEANNKSNWDEVMQRQGYSVLNDYEYPQHFYIELSKIAQYCKLNKINLSFIIFPNHPHFFNIISELNLEDERARFKSDIYGLANTFDFNVENSITRNQDLFVDLYHTKHFVTDSLTKFVWGSQYGSGGNLK